MVGNVLESNIDCVIVTYAMDRCFISSQGMVVVVVIVIVAVVTDFNHFGTK